MRHSSILFILALWMVGCDNGSDPDPSGSDELSITEFAPLTAAYDSIVTITGAGFSETPGNNIVTLNGIAATVTAATDNELKIKIPKNKNCSGSLTVTVASESVTAAESFTYEFTYTVTTLAGNNTGVRASVDGMGTAAKFFGPSGIAIDETGVLYVTESLGHRIRRIATDGLVTTLAGNGESGYADGPAAEATFSSPKGIAVSDVGIIYVTDTGRDIIRKIQGGVVSTIAGDRFGFSDGTGTAAKFDNPNGIAITKLGKIYIADHNNYRLRTMDGVGVVSTLAGSSTRGMADGQGSSAQFEGPTAVCVDKSGDAYVADEEVGFNAVRKVTQAGVVTTIAGGPNHGHVDGTGAEAKFAQPLGITMDGDGNLYVTDKNWIRKITPEGVVTTLAGSGNYESVDGVGANASFKGPIGIAVSSSGILYVVEYNGDLIRKLIPE